MIRYRPAFPSLSASLKAEETFDTMDDMLRYVLDHWRLVFSFVGGTVPFQSDEITLGEVLGDDPRSGYLNMRRVFVTRMSDVVYPSPLCIGFCGE